MATGAQTSATQELVQAAEDAIIDGPANASSGVLLIVAGAIVALALAGRASRVAGRFATRLGVGSETGLGRSGRLLQWGLFALFGLFVARKLLSPLPPWALSLSIIGLTTVLLISTGALSDLLGGLLAQFRFGLEEGDQVRVGACEGEVRAVLLGRIALRTADGQQLVVPGRKLLTEVVEVAPLRRAYPAVLSIAAARPFTDGELAQLRERILMMPYRVPSSPLDIVQSGGELAVRCQVWRQSAVVHAEQRIRRDCAQLSQEGV